MRRAAVGGCLAVVLCALAVSEAQRMDAPIRWIPVADSALRDMTTLTIKDEQSGEVIEHPLVCVDPGGGWMIGMKDGRLRFGGSVSDTLRLRIFGPLHLPRAISFAWKDARGSAADIALARRPNGRMEPEC